MRQQKYIVAFACFWISSSTAFADALAFKAVLAPSAEVPPVASEGTGQATFSYDTVSKELSFTVTFERLGSAVTASHIHGPAGPGQNAAIVRTFAVPESPISGQIRLTDAQASELAAGQLYVDVHTSAHPQGEIRGQITK